MKKSKAQHTPGQIRPDRINIPEQGQPGGKYYPPEEVEVTGEPRPHLVENSNAYENMPEDRLEDRGAAERGPFDIPDDDQAGEGWVPPMDPGHGWEHPVDRSLEERLDHVEGIEGDEK